MRIPKWIDTDKIDSIRYWFLAFEYKKIRERYKKYPRKKKKKEIKKYVAKMLKPYAI